MSHNPPSAPDLAARIIDHNHGTTALHQAAEEGTLQNLCGVTAAFLASVKATNGWSPLHNAAWHGHLDQIPGVTAELLATVKDNDGNTPLHDVAWRGHLDQILGVTAEFLANVKSNNDNTPLHLAAQCGHLDQVPGVTAELLATVKDNGGKTPLHYATDYNHLAQIPDITITLATTLGLLNAALRPENIAAFTEDFRCHGAHYNHCPTVSTALIEAANQLPDLSPTQRTAIKTALSAAQEGGFVLPSEALARLL
jgi:ankyrin repeat protein